MGLIALLPILLLVGPSHAFSTTTIKKFQAPSTTRRSASYMDSLSGAEPLDFSAPAAPAAPATAASSDIPGFDSVPILGLHHADAIASAAVAVCQRNGFSPVTVTVLDASGCTIVLKRMDGCSVVGFPDFARAKAYGSIIMKYPSREFRDKYTADEESAKFCQMMGMVALSGGQMAPFPGGIVLKLGDYVIGAVGVSGASGDEDEYCAIQGVKEANVGLTTNPEAHSCATVTDGN